MMYNIWCEVKKANIVLVVIGIVMTIISFFVDKTSETIFLLILTFYNQYNQMEYL